jgi:hypothetical protein
MLAYIYIYIEREREREIHQSSQWDMPVSGGYRESMCTTGASKGFGRGKVTFSLKQHGPAGKPSQTHKRCLMRTESGPTSIK